MEKIVDFVRFPYVAITIWGEITDYARNRRILETHVPKLELVMTLSVWKKKEIEICDKP